MEVRHAQLLVEKQPSSGRQFFWNMYEGDKNQKGKNQIIGRACEVFRERMQELQVVDDENNYTRANDGYGLATIDLNKARRKHYFDATKKFLKVLADSQFWEENIERYVRGKLSKFFDEEQFLRPKGGNLFEGTRIRNFILKLEKGTFKSPLQYRFKDFLTNLSDCESRLQEIKKNLLKEVKKIPKVLDNISGALESVTDTRSQGSDRKKKACKKLAPFLEEIKSSLEQRDLKKTIQLSYQEVFGFNQYMDLGFYEDLDSSSGKSMPYIFNFMESIKTLYEDYNNLKSEVDEIHQALEAKLGEKWSDSLSCKSNLKEQLELKWEKLVKKLEEEQLELERKKLEEKLEEELKKASCLDEVTPGRINRNLSRFTRSWFYLALSVASVAMVTFSIYWIGMKMFGCSSRKLVKLL